MSEDSLLADVESTPNEESAVVEGEAAPAEEASPWYVSEGVEGTGDKPGFMLDKYGSMSDQAAAYPELAKKLGGFTGAPDDYEVTMPEGLEGEFVQDDVMMNTFKEWGKETGLSQEHFNTLMHAFVNNEVTVAEANKEQELAAIGDNAGKRLQNISDYAKANLSEEDYDGILAATTTAAGVKAVEALIAQTRGYKIPKNDAEVDTGISHSDIKERMKDPRYQTDPAFRAETSKLYERKFGSGPTNQTIG